MQKEKYWKEVHENIGNSRLLSVASSPWSQCAPSSPFPKLFPQMEKKKQENKMRRDQLNDQYLELLEKQRLYFKTVKEFKEVRRRWGQPQKAVGGLCVSQDEP